MRRGDGDQTAMGMKRDKTRNGRGYSRAASDARRLREISAKEVLELLGAVVVLVVSSRRRERIDVQHRRRDGPNEGKILADFALNKRRRFRGDAEDGVAELENSWE